MKFRLWRAAAVAPILGFTILNASATLGSDSWNMNPSWVIRSESSYAIQVRDGHGQKFGNQISVDLTFDPTPNLQVVARTRVSAEILDSLDPGGFDGESYGVATRPASPGPIAEIANREFFLQWSRGPLRARIGKQQLVWGEADGIKVLDVLNPQDFREFILPSFSESRIALWALRLDLELGAPSWDWAASWFTDGGSLQLLFIPDPTVHHIPDIQNLGNNTDAQFAPTSRRLVPTPPVAFASAVDFQTVQRKREWRPSSFDAGTRITIPIAKVDTALYYMWRIDDSPVVAYGPGSIELDGTRLFLQIPVELEYRRHHMAGASFSTALADFVLRGEFSYTFGRDISQLYVVPPSVIDDSNSQVADSDDIAWVLGLDWFGPSDLFVSTQVFQNVILQHEDQMLRRKVETAMTFFAKRKFLDDRLSAELMIIQGLNDGDGLVRPRIDYELTDYLSVWIAGDVFYGNADGYFGQYDANDRIVVGIAAGWTSD